MSYVTEEEYLTHLCVRGTSEICDICVQYETQLLELNEKEKNMNNDENVPVGFESDFALMDREENEVLPLGELPDEPEEVNE